MTASRAAERPGHQGWCLPCRGAGGRRGPSRRKRALSFSQPVSRAAERPGHQDSSIRIAKRVAVAVPRGGNALCLFLSQYPVRRSARATKTAVSGSRSGWPSWSLAAERPGHPRQQYPDREAGGKRALSFSQPVSRAAERPGHQDSFFLYSPDYRIRIRVPESRPAHTTVPAVPGCAIELPSGPPATLPSERSSPRWNRRTT